MKGQTKTNVNAVKPLPPVNTGAGFGAGKKKAKTKGFKKELT